MDTLATVQLTLPLAGCVEDFHLQVNAPCRAHIKKAPETRRLMDRKKLTTQVAQADKATLSAEAKSRRDN